MAVALSDCADRRHHRPGCPHCQYYQPNLWIGGDRERERPWAIGRQVYRRTDGDGAQYGDFRNDTESVLADAIAADPYAIGFFGYAFYQDQADRLRPLAIDGVAPNQATATDGSYALPHVRLHLYTGERILAKQPATTFLDHLQHVNDVIEEVGYFPISDDELAKQDTALRTATGGPVSEGDVGDIVISGSSTVYPLTVRIAEMFAATGHNGTVTVESTGTKGGYAALCVDKTAEIADSSRAIARQETAACVNPKRVLVEIRGADAIAVVVSSENDFVRDVTQAEMQAIFSTADRWSDVRRLA